MSKSPQLTLVRQGAQYDTFRGVILDGNHATRVVLKMPHEVIDNHGILVAPGFSDGTSGPDYLTNYFAEQGRVAYTLDHPRTDDPKFKNDPEGQKANSLRLVTEQVTDQFDLEEKEDVVAHSEGGGNSTRYAIEHMDRVRSVTVMASGGLIEDDTYARIVKRTLGRLRHMNREHGSQLLRHPVHELHMLGNCIGYVASNPPKALKEAVAISVHDIRGRFPLLSINGIPNAALQFGGDEIFPLHLVKESTDNGDIFDQFTVYPYDPNAGHITPQYHPRKVGKLVLDGIHTMITSEYKLAS